MIKLTISSKIYNLVIITLLGLSLLLLACQDVSNVVLSTPTKFDEPNTTATPFALTQRIALPYLPYEPVYSNDWVVSAFEENNCSGRCWQGIIPGQTTITQTRKLLGQKTFIDDLKYSRTNHPTEYLTEWFWMNDIGFGTINYKESKEGVIVVSELRLVLPRTINLEILIRLFGEPTKVQVIPVNSRNGVRSYYTTAINDNVGYALFNDSQAKLSLSKDTGFYGISFFEPGNVEKKLLNKLDPKYIDMLDWEGYKDNAFYCRRDKVSPDCPQ